eukprot:scaffold52462_cov71-Phaeocystis_antarctica.AAC.7
MKLCPTNVGLARLAEVGAARFLLAAGMRQRGEPSAASVSTQPVMIGGTAAAGRAAQLRLRGAGAARRGRLWPEPGWHELGQVGAVRVRDEHEVVRRPRPVAGRSGWREE